MVRNPIGPRRLSIYEVAVAIDYATRASDIPRPASDTSMILGIDVSKVGDV